ncbi:MAG: pknH 2 [Akkermansiaceae bacterium]|nr:pknH 2 [Akkermansiaceae bacterium]
MTPALHCLECEAPIDSADTGGLCPKCLLKLGLANTGFGFGTGTRLPLNDDAEPLAFGSWRVLGMLGKGGMGAVYEAEQAGTGRRVALKILGQMLDSAELRQRFLREGQLAASVRHPNVVGVISAEEVEGVQMIAMELLHDGTLEERVRKGGPMAVTDAVDAILQIIDGLEAAAAVGVLHRDVKPANCFISADGVAKIGDFGLSVSTFAGAEAALTQAGTVVGTPAFAAPEQLQGQDLDERADMYSVGATLYYLLTGRTTHEADGLVALIAAVLTKQPVKPRTLRPEIPKALERVILRCLERNKAQRYANYGELRSALEPFRTELAPPALLGLRIVAGIVDLFLAGAPWTVLMLLNFERMMKGGGPLLGLAQAVFTLAYFVVLEGRWGTTPGKMLCGLRVAREAGGYPGYGRALVRGLVFFFDRVALVLLLNPLALQHAHATWELALGGLPYLVMMVLASTMRRRNGFAMLQDLASGTRVVAAPLDRARQAVTADQPVAPEWSAEAEMRGPYRVVRRLSAAVLEAWDGVLCRHVWIAERAEGFPALTPARRNLSRPGRLHWLQGVRDAAAGENWDAFEAPPGRPLAELADGAQPWSRVRHWLLEVATEYLESGRDGTRPAGISFRRVWITRGGAVWLDFPLTDSARDTRDTRDSRGELVDPVTPLENIGALQRFLGRAAAACVETARPLHATQLIRTLAEERLDSAEMVCGNLRAAQARPAVITRRRRMISLILWPLLALLMMIPAVVLMQPSVLSQRPVRAEMESRRAATQERPVAAPAGPAVAGPAVADARTGEAAEKNPKPPPLEGGAAFARNFPSLVAFIMMISYATTLILALVFSLVWALATGEPPGLQFYGLALLRSRSGEKASRWRAALRCLLGVVPPVLILTVAGGVAMEWMESTAYAVLISGAALAALLALAVHTWLRPRRALADLLLGTVVVPR